MSRLERSRRPHAEGLVLSNYGPDGRGHCRLLYTRACTCGWKTPLRPTRYEADELLAEHFYQMTLEQIERQAI